MTVHSTGGRPGPDLTGRVALVTGAGSGIGAATATLLAGLGAEVVVADLSPDSAERVAGEIVAGGGTAYAVAVDVTDASSVDTQVAGVVQRSGGLHIAVNNAGVAVPMVPLADLTDEHWRHVTSVNLDGVFHCLRAELRVMRAGGGGAIVNMSSVLGKVARPGSAAYVGTKHAVIGLTRGAAVDHAADGIRVNSIGPGFIRTPLLEGRHTEQALAEVTSRWALDRLGEPDEIAQAVAWLVSDASSFVTGTHLAVDGGYLAS